ncbi:vacuolar protein sorting-associated protein 54 [Condylostylus longicornis]|uniref:vacuolar protein sorting-associated protein 54 n=1 Tax=Condylostylus longicornis TaxID=2530218 RepID=UPI00244DAD74|nr:vacuolar protein sorting-associated protein 54 [Condylostylus longicornis]
MATYHDDFISMTATTSKEVNKNPWEKCYYCPMQQPFKLRSEFIKHLRERHCTKEGGSYVCRYGFNGVCQSSVLDGVSDQDYETHVAKYHINLIQREPEWSVFSAAQNLPAVLNDPSKGKQTNLFTKKWGDSFVEKSHIPPSQYLDPITWDDFDSYQKRIGRRFRRHLRYTTDNVQQNKFENDKIEAFRKDSNASSQSSRTMYLKSDIDIINGEVENFTTSNIGNLDDIPQIFMKASLELNNPETFAQVFPGIGKSNEESKQSGRLLQEKLSHYLDIVEVHIAKQVSQKSSAFFHAMTSQDTIMEQMNAATSNVKFLRKRLQYIDTTLVKDSLKILLLSRSRQNYFSVLDKLKLMQTVQQTQPMIQLLLGTQDYVAALDLISTTQEICAQALIGIHCFRHLPMQLKEIEKLIDKMLSTEFERYSTADLNRPYLNSDDEGLIEEDKLVCIIMGLLRENNYSFIDGYKEEAITAIKANIKQMVIEIIASSDAEVCLTGAGEEAQSLSIPDWIQLLDKATITLLKLLKRVQKVYTVIKETADASAGKCGETLQFIDSEVFLSENDYKIVIEKLEDLLRSVCNYCHERCANLVSSQSLEKSVATQEEIEKLSQIVEEFSQGCEKISGIQSVPLRAAVKAQATRFSNNFHSERKSKLALLLDSERWKQVDIPNEFQKIIDRISKNDFSGFQKSSKEILSLHLSTEAKESQDSNLSSKNTSSSSPSSPVLLVDGKPYTLVSSIILLVHLITEYCKCAEQIPIVAGQMSRHVVDLLRTFNSRSCQLVLGAGALHVAGLKTITSGNLALVSRALQIILWLLPKVKLHFQKLDSTSIGGYDIVEKDFVSHIKEIEQKVLSIVSNLVINQLQSWDARPPVPSQSFRNISKHFVKLHEAIATILPEQQIHSIYRVIHKNFKDKLREQLLKYNIVNNGGPQHGVVTSELIFYMETLKTLKALPTDEMNDNTLDDIWLK